MKRMILFLGLTIYCLTSFSQTTGTFTDSRDSKVYKTITIGTQTWMAENLAYLPSVTGTGTSDGYWVYGYDGTDVTGAKLTNNYLTYGVLYNWEKANNACPTGWHLPSVDEWTKLITFLGGDEVAGNKMKETGKIHWKSPNTDVTNSSFFNALPAGFYEDDSFLDIGYHAQFWSSNFNTNKGWTRYLYSHEGTAKLGLIDKQNGCSVRCMKD
jgi:uncharacterized protein (TIGR02145 family)